MRQLLNIVMLKGLHSAKHHVKNDSSTPNVNLVGVWLTGEHFRSTKLHDACVCLHHLCLRIVLPRHIEINYENLIVTLPH